MKKILLTLTALAAASLFTACGDSAANNTANKPANAAPSNANSAAAAPPDTKAAEAEIRKIMDTAQAALPTKDAADTMEKIYADNYTITNIDGSKQNKEERLKSLRSGEVKYTAFAYKDSNIVISADGNSANVTAKLSMKGTMKGKPFDGDYNVTQAYTKTKDGWKQTSASATKIEGGAAKPDDKAKAANTSNTPKTGDPKKDALATDDDAPAPKKK